MELLAIHSAHTDGKLARIDAGEFGNIACHLAPLTPLASLAVQPIDQRLKLFRRKGLTHECDSSNSLTRQAMVPPSLLAVNANMPDGVQA